MSKQYAIGTRIDLKQAKAKQARMDEIKISLFWAVLIFAFMACLFSS